MGPAIRRGPAPHAMRTLLPFAPWALLGCMLPVLSVPVAATEIDVAYRVVTAAGQGAQLFLAVRDTSGEETMFIADCAEVWPAAINTNMVLGDLDCDGAIVVTSIAREGLRVELGPDDWTIVELVHGRHMINGIPALIDGGETLQ